MGGGRQQDISALYRASHSFPPAFQQHRQKSLVLNGLRKKIESREIDEQQYDDKRTDYRWFKWL